MTATPSRRLRGHFLNSASNAARASSGVATPRRPVRSNVFAGAKNSHVLPAFFETIRAGIVCVHSQRADESKWTHWLHEWSAAPHLRQTAATPTSRDRAPARRSACSGTRRPWPDRCRVPAARRRRRAAASARTDVFGRARPSPCIRGAGTCDRRSRRIDLLRVG